MSATSRYLKALLAFASVALLGLMPSEGAKAENNGSLEAVWSENASVSEPVGDSSATSPPEANQITGICSRNSFLQSDLIKTSTWPEIGPFAAAAGDALSLSDGAKNHLTLAAAGEQITGAQLDLTACPNQTDTFLKLQMAADFLLEAFAIQPEKIHEFNLSLEKELTSSKKKQITDPFQADLGQVLLAIVPMSAQETDAAAPGVRVAFRLQIAHKAGGAPVLPVGQQNIKAGEDEKTRAVIERAAREQSDRNGQDARAPKVEQLSHVHEQPEVKAGGMKRPSQLGSTLSGEEPSAKPDQVEIPPVAANNRYLEPLQKVNKESRQPKTNVDQHNQADTLINKPHQETNDKMAQAKGKPVSDSSMKKASQTTNTNIASAKGASLQQDFLQAVQNWQTLKKKAVRQRDASGLVNALAGKALIRQSEAIKWLTANHKYYEMTPKGVSIKNIAESEPGKKYCVSACVRESTKYVDETTGQTIKETDDTYNVNYTVEKVAGRWLITDSNIAKAATAAPSKQAAKVHH